MKLTLYILGIIFLILNILVIIGSIYYKPVKNVVFNYFVTFCLIFSLINLGIIEDTQKFIKNKIEQWKN